MTDDVAGFDLFVGAHQAALVRLGWALTGDQLIGEDLAQTALVRVWQHWDRVVAGGDPWPYVQKIVVNLASTWRHRKYRRAETTVAVVPDGPSTPDASSGPEDRAWVAGYLASLPPRQRAVLSLRFLLDQSVEETAAVLGCSPGTVKSQTAKALQRLREAGPERHREETPV